MVFIVNKTQSSLILVKRHHRVSKVTYICIYQPVFYQSRGEKLSTPQVCNKLNVFPNLTQVTTFPDYALNKKTVQLTPIEGIY